MASRKLERDLRMGTMTSRRGLMEREKAMDAARNPGISKLGGCLVAINSKTDKMLTSNLRKINSEIKRMELQANQKMKHFIRNSGVLNHDPLILVERPPSPETVKRAKSMMHVGGEYDLPPGDVNKPGYMQKLRTRARTPSTLTTIDAFVIKSRKKKNVWEGAIDEKSSAQFQSTVRPYAKLNKRELSDLQKGYEFHKPKVNESGPSDIEDTGSKSASRKKKLTKKKVKDSAAIESGDSDIDELTPFITQMSTARKKKKSAPKSATQVGQPPRPKSPILVVQDANDLGLLTVEKENERSVRFASPVALSEPGSKQPRRKLKTKATRVTY